MPKLISKQIIPSAPSFEEVRKWFNKHLSPDNNSFDDQNVYRHVYEEGRFPAVFQCTNSSTQKFFMKAKPKSILEIATLTAIYRPGPLSANVDKLYLDARSGKKYDWGHSLINETLKGTDNLLIFQEQTMDLAEKVGGFPKSEVDDVRRVITKKVMIGDKEGEEKLHKIEERFVEGAKKNGLNEKIARKAFSDIKNFSKYGFNLAHSVAYAINSYICAWFLTYYPDEWLATYLDSASGKPDDRAQAFAEIKQLGYSIVKLDINYAGLKWSSPSPKKLMPSLLTCKGIGLTAVDEILQNRPYKTMEDVLWNADGTWRHSKFNKKTLDALIKTGAFDSLDIIGEGKQFSSYRHLHHVVIENSDLIRKTSKKDPLIGQKNYYQIIKETQGMSEWSGKEFAEFKMEIFGSVDINTLISNKQYADLKRNNFSPINQWNGCDLYWFIVLGSTTKKTRTNKDYLVLDVAGEDGKNIRLNIWNPKQSYERFTVCVGEIDKNDYGYSSRKIEILEE